MAGKRTDLNSRHQSRGGPEDWLSRARDTSFYPFPGGRPSEWRKDFAPPPWITLEDVLSKKSAVALVESLPRCLGRKRGQLSEDEALALSEILWHWRGRKSASHMHKVSKQDQLRTLRGIASEKDDASVIASYRRCDAKTRAEIQESLRKASEERLPASAVGLSEAAISAFRQSRWRIFRSLENEPDALRRAAQSAAERLAINPQQGGRPPSEYQRGFAEACLVIWQQMGGDPDAAIWDFDCSNPEPSPLLRFAGLLFDALEGTDGFDLTKVRRLLTEAREQGKVSPPS